ncbi:MAG: DUF4349 domain-containing protein [Fimbriimonadaceae bacterium]
MNEREDIKAYIDGELSSERANEVRLAIESDPALMQEYTFMKDTSSKIASLLRQPQVQGAEKALQAARPVRKFRWIEGIAVAGAVVVLGAMIFPYFAQAKLATKGGGARTNVATSFDADLEQADMESLASDAEAKWRDEGQPRDLGGDIDNGLAPSMGAPTEILGYPRAAQDPTLSAGAPMAEDAEALVRQVIKDGSYAFEVADVQKAVDDTTIMVKGYKGYVESNSNSGTEESKPRAFMTLRVPEQHYEDAITKLKSLGKLRSENTSGQDVTAKVADIEARIKTLKVEEESYRELLRHANKVGDILDIKERISVVRQQIESYDAQRLTMRRLAALSTITVQFEEEAKATDEPKPDDWFDDTKLSAILMLKGIGKFIAQAGTFLFVLSPVWLPALLFALWFRRRALTPAV